QQQMHLSENNASKFYFSLLHPLVHPWTMRITKNSDFGDSAIEFPCVSPYNKAGYPMNVDDSSSTASRNDTERIEYLKIYIENLLLSVRYFSSFSMIKFSG
ncbi:hypothetical protein IFM89_038181, partial [Coptis chinensis]